MACALRARAALALFLLVLGSLGASARAQDIVACDAAWVDVPRLRTLLSVEAASFGSRSFEGLRFQVADCADDHAIVLVYRDDVLIDGRRVELDDAPPTIRLRLVAYVFAEILLASTRPGPSVPAEEGASPAAAAGEAARDPEAAEAVELDAHEEPERIPHDAVFGPALRPWHVTLDGGVRWFPRSRMHVGTYRFTTSVGRMLVEARHSFGPFLGNASPGSSPDETVRFQAITVGIGFRYRRMIGDDAVFVDGVGAAGFVFLERFDANGGASRGTTRFATAGLEARAGVEAGFGRVRGTVAAEFGYCRPRTGPRADFDPPPELRRVDGVFVGMTLGLGWETRSGLRGMGLLHRRRVLGADDAP